MNKPRFFAILFSVMILFVYFAGSASAGEVSVYDWVVKLNRAVFGITGAQVAEGTASSEVPINSVSLSSVTIDNENLRVVYSKNFDTCAHLLNSSQALVHKKNLFCQKGENIEVVQPLSYFSISEGKSVKLCHGNNYGTCSGLVTVAKKESKPACEDSDNGKDYKTIGTTTGPAPETGLYGTHTDYCGGSDGNSIYEGYCFFSEHLGTEARAVDVYTCPNGCKDGACVKDSAQQCVRANPTVTISPDYQAVSAGSAAINTVPTATYKVTITNNDNAACGSSKFLATWWKTENPAVVTVGNDKEFDWRTNKYPVIKPGESYTFDLYATAVYKAAEGTYTVGLTIKNGDVDSYAGDASAKLLVKSDVQAFPDVSVDWITIAPGSYQHYVGNELIAMVTIRNIGTADVECAHYCKEGQKDFPVTFSVRGILPDVMSYSEGGATINGWNDVGVMKLTATIPPLKPGESRSFDIKLRFSEAGDYKFVANAGSAPGPAGGFTNEDDEHSLNNWKEISSNVLPKSEIKCSDSDGGKREFEKGKTSIKGDDVHYDACYGKDVVEYYCSYNSEISEEFMKKDVVDCLYGCQDGACIKQEDSKDDLTTGASWQCYDGSVGATGGSEGLCLSEKDLRSLAEGACEGSCSKETGKCGVNSFSVSVSGECLSSPPSAYPPAEEVPPEVPPERSYVYDVQLKKGWNLVGLGLFSLNSGNDAFETSCKWLQEKNYPSYLKSNLFGYDALSRRYVSGEELHIKDPSAGDYLVNSYFNSFWLRSTEDCSIIMDLSSEAESGELFKLLQRIPDNGYKLAKGWNFFAVWPEMEGKTLDDIKGGCDVKRNYAYDASGNKWFNFKGIKLDHDSVGYGFVMKVADDCVFGSSSALPPPLPEDEAQKAIPVAVQATTTVASSAKKII